MPGNVLTLPMVQTASLCLPAMERISSASFAAAASASWRAFMGVDPECASWPKKVIGVALHAFGAQHDAERQLHALQHRPLFDVQFQIRRGVLLLARGFGKAIDRKAAARHGVFQADAVFVGAAAVGFDGSTCRRMPTIPANCGQSARLLRRPNPPRARSPAAAR